MTYLVRAWVLLLALLLSSCGPTDLWLRGQRPASPVRGTIGLASARLLQELPGGLKADPFSEGLTVGHVQLSGGYVVQEELGRQVRSKESQIEGQQAYRKQALEWADGALEAVLGHRGLPWVRVELPASSIPVPTRRDVRGSTPEDGTDNVNLPRFTLQPAPIDPALLTGLPSTAQALLVPIVVQYYSHNGGWFIGQRWGCAGGARLRLFWTLYDRTSGAPLAWEDIEARAISPRNFSPNSAQIQDLLLEVEQKLRRTLEREMLR